jgi:hypothetical protein
MSVSVKNWSFQVLSLLLFVSLYRFELNLPSKASSFRLVFNSEWINLCPYLQHVLYIRLIFTRVCTSMCRTNLYLWDIQLAGYGCAYMLIIFYLNNHINFISFHFYNSYVFLNLSSYLFIGVYDKDEMVPYSDALSSLN